MCDYASKDVFNDPNYARSGREQITCSIFYARKSLSGSHKLASKSYCQPNAPPPSTCPWKSVPVTQRKWKEEKSYVEFQAKGQNGFLLASLMNQCALILNIYKLLKFNGVYAV